MVMAMGRVVVMVMPTPRKRDVTRNKRTAFFFGGGGVYNRQRVPAAHQGRARLIGVRCRLDMIAYPFPLDQA